MRWLFVGLVVGATTLSDLLQSKEMKRQGAERRYRPTLLLGLSVLCMAVSFFSFLRLLELADLSFAVPATAVSLVLETILARAILHERIHARRWIGAVLVACGVAILGHS